MSTTAQAPKTPDRATFIKQCETDIETCIVEIGAQLRIYIPDERIVRDRRTRVYKLHTLARDARKVINEADLGYLDITRATIMSAEIAYESGIETAIKNMQSRPLDMTLADVISATAELDRMQVEGDPLHMCSVCGSNRKKRNGTKGMGACVNEACPDRFYDLRESYRAEQGVTTYDREQGLTMSIDRAPEGLKDMTQVFTIKQEFKDIDPDRVANAFRAAVGNECPCSICVRMRKVPT